MGSLSWRKIAGYAGIAQVVLFLALGMTIFDSPQITDSAADVREYFTDNADTINLFNWVAPLTMGVLFIIFASGLRNVLRSADSASEGMWTRVMFAGAVSQLAIGLVGLMFWGVLAQEDILAELSDGTVLAINAMDQILFFAMLNWAAAIFLVGASIVILQSGVMAKWIGWLGVVLAAAGVIGSLWTFSGDSGGFFAIPGTIAFLGVLVWTVAVSVTMIRSAAE